MKTISFFFLLMAVAFTSKAQVPNGDFESSDGWHVVEGPENFKLNPDAQQGNFSGVIWTSNNKTVTLENHEYFPFGGALEPAGHPTNIAGSLSGFYQYQNSASGCADASVTVLVFNYNDEGEIVTRSSGATYLEPGTGWEGFYVELEEELPLTEDSRVVVSFTTGKGCEIGSCCFLSLDGLRLGGGKPPHQRNGTNRTGRGGRK